MKRKHNNKVTMNPLYNLRIRIYQQYSKPDFSPRKVMFFSKCDILNTKCVFIPSNQGYPLRIN